MPEMIKFIGPYDYETVQDCVHWQITVLFGLLVKDNVHLMVPYWLVRNGINVSDNR